MSSSRQKLFTSSPAQQLPSSRSNQPQHLYAPHSLTKEHFCSEREYQAPISHPSHNLENIDLQSTATNTLSLEDNKLGRSIQGTVHSPSNMMGFAASPALDQAFSAMNLNSQHTSNLEISGTSTAPRAGNGVFALMPYNQAGMIFNGQLYSGFGRGLNIQHFDGPGSGVAGFATHLPSLQYSLSAVQIHDPSSTPDNPYNSSVHQPFVPGVGQVSDSHSTPTLQTGAMSNVHNVSNPQLSSPSCTFPPGPGYPTAPSSCTGSYMGGLTAHGAVAWDRFADTGNKDPGDGRLAPSSGHHIIYSSQPPSVEPRLAPLGSLITFSSRVGKDSGLGTRSGELTMHNTEAGSGRAHGIQYNPGGVVRSAFTTRNNAGLVSNLNPSSAPFRPRRPVAIVATPYGQVVEHSTDAIVAATAASPDYHAKFPKHVKDVAAIIGRKKLELQSHHGREKKSSYNASYRALQDLGWNIKNPGSLRPAEWGMSSNYGGDATLIQNRSAPIPHSMNCSLFIIGLPPSVSYTTLLRSIRGFGKVWQCVINGPEVGLFYTAAAKITFFEHEPAEMLMRMALRGQWFVMGKRITKVNWNRNKVQRIRSRREESRVVRITGEPDVMDTDYLNLVLSHHIHYQIDSIFPVERNDGKVTQEWHFGSYRCQAQSVVMLLQTEFVGIYDVEFARDPCGP